MKINTRRVLGAYEVEMLPITPPSVTRSRRLLLPFISDLELVYTQVRRLGQS
jgi:hypothetical protein